MENTIIAKLEYIKKSIDRIERLLKMGQAEAVKEVMVRESEVLLKRSAELYSMLAEESEVK